MTTCQLTNTMITSSLRAKRKMRSGRVSWRRPTRSCTEDMRILSRDSVIGSLRSWVEECPLRCLQRITRRIRTDYGRRSSPLMPIITSWLLDQTHMSWEIRPAPSETSSMDTPTRSSTQRKCKATSWWNSRILTAAAAGNGTVTSQTNLSTWMTGWCNS